MWNITAIRSAGSITVLLLAVACGSGDSRTADPATDPVGLAPAPPTTPAPTTSLPETTTTRFDPDELAKSFFAFLADPDVEAEADLTLTVAGDGETLVGSGRAVIDGADSAMHLQLLDQELDVVTVDGVEYVSRNGGPWVREEGAAESSATEPEVLGVAEIDIVPWLLRLAAPDYAGTERIRGQDVHRFDLPAGRLDPALFALPEDFTVAAAFWVDDDGTPRAIEFDLEGASTAGLPLQMTLRMDFTSHTAGSTVAAPPRPWQLHVSSDLGYSIGHPPSWDMVEERQDGRAADYIFALEEEIGIYRMDLVAPGAVPLNSVLIDSTEVLVAEMEGEMGEVTEATVAGYPARMVAYTYIADSGPASGVTLVVQVDPATVFQFVYIDWTGDPDQDLERTAEFVSTFQVVEMPPVLPEV